MSDNDLLTRLENSYEAFSVPLRMGDGFDAKLFSELSEVLGSCRVSWEGRESVPKRAASIFVDAYSSMVSSSYLYSDEKREEIEMKADELADLIRECVEV